MFLDFLKTILKTDIYNNRYIYNTLTSAILFQTRGLSVHSYTAVPVWNMATR